MFFQAIIVLLILCAGYSCTSVIIIGAGPAGIAAATQLLESGITNITVLEAENRLGGRIHSVPFGDAIVDLGAEFCHGLNGNVVYQLVKDLDLLEYNVFDDPARIYYSNGSKLNDRLSQEVQSLALTFDLGGAETAGRSVGELFLQQYNAILVNKYRNDSDTLRVLNDGLKSAEAVLLVPEGSYSWFSPSAEKHYQECEGYQVNAWRGRGYKTVLDILMRSYPDPSKKLDFDGKLLLNSTVTRIDWSNNLVEVSTNFNTYLADYVIFTPSIGVLKERHQQLFNPRLPALKQRAIEQIGFDGIMKIIMHFPRQWWRDDDDFFAFVWSQQDLNDLDLTLGSNYTWITNLNILVRASNNSRVRMAWLTGEVVKEIETLPLDTLRAGVAFVLKKFLGKDYDVVAPDSIIRSSWCTNPNFRGTYSYEKAQFFQKEISNQKILGEPLRNQNGRPVVLFAGEATNPIHYSTVHGAIETGHREAKRILALVEQDNDVNL